MSLFKLLFSFFLSFFASIAISTARFAPYGTQPRSGVEIHSPSRCPPTTRFPSALLPQQTQRNLSSPEKDSANRPESCTLRLSSLRNGRRQRRRRTSFPVDDAGNWVPTVENFSVSSPVCPSPTHRGRLFPAALLLTPCAAHATECSPSCAAELRHPKRRFNHIQTSLPSEVWSKEEQSDGIITSPCSRSTTCSRCNTWMHSFEGFSSDVESSTRNVSSVTRKSLSFRSGEVPSRVSEKNNQFLTTQKKSLQVQQHEAGRSSFKEFSTRSTPIKLHSSETLFFLLKRGSALFSPSGGLSLTASGASLRIPKRLFQSHLTASIPRSRDLYRSSTARCVSNTSPPPSSRLIPNNYSSDDSLTTQKNLLSFTEAVNTSQWPPWLPYGLPAEAILPKGIGEGTSAASLQYAKKVFLELLESGRLTQSLSSSISSATAAPDACRRRDGETQRRGDALSQDKHNQQHLAAAAAASDNPPSHIEDNIARSTEASYVEPTNTRETSVHPEDRQSTTPPLQEQHVRIFAAFAEKYVQEVALSGRLTAQTAINILASTWQLAWKYSNYPFKPYHRALLSPLDFSAWSEMMWRPLIDLSRSKIVLPLPDTSSCSSHTSSSPSSPASSTSLERSAAEGSVTAGAASVSFVGGSSGAVSPLQMIKEKLERKENIVFLSNHQTEPDPQVLKLVFEHLGERDLGQRIIFVAGHKVREDPLSIPFSLGCNLLCVHSKKHLTSGLLPAEEQHRRQQQNVAAMAALQQVLEEGSALVWVAPSGGRDRQDERGQFSTPDKFDAKAVRMFRLLAKKAQATAGRVTHFCPVALYTAPICPPPEKVEGRLGEPRTCAFSPVGVGVGNILHSDESCTHEAFTMEAEAETRRLYELIKP